MKRWFALSAIGPDRPGIVADLAELIYECDCNLEDSSMTILGSEFAVLLLLTGEGDDVEARLSAACKRLEWEKRLTVFFRPLEGEPVSYAVSHHARTFDLHAVGIDKAGIVARIARCLYTHLLSADSDGRAARRRRKRITARTGHRRRRAQHRSDPALRAAVNARRADTSRFRDPCFSAMSKMEDFPCLV